MHRWCVTGAALTLLIASAPAFGQSLADIARKEEARRAEAPKAKKSYSNADLGPGGVPEPEAAPAEDANCYQSKSEGKCVTADELVANSASAAKVVEEAPREDTIRKQAESLRAELANTQREIDQLVAKSENAALPPAQRQLAAETLVLKQPALAGFQRRWARLEQQIKENKLPHAWIEPVPANALPPQ
jgi:hypothetical protein